MSELCVIELLLVVVVVVIIIILLRMNTLKDIFSIIWQSPPVSGVSSIDPQFTNTESEQVCSEKRREGKERKNRSDDRM